MIETGCGTDWDEVGLIGMDWDGVGNTKSGDGCGGLGS